MFFNQRAIETKIDDLIEKVRQLECYVKNETMIKHFKSMEEGCYRRSNTLSLEQMRENRLKKIEAHLEILEKGHPLLFKDAFVRSYYFGKLPKEPEYIPRKDAVEFEISLYVLEEHMIKPYKCYCTKEAFAYMNPTKEIKKSKKITK